MDSTDKSLLDLEKKSSLLESKLVVCKKDNQDPPRKKPNFASVPKSQVLGKVKDFLGVMSEANKKLELDAKNNPQNYDIEVLSEKESEYIEMDLMLGLAELHTPESVAAAESAITGYQPVIPLEASSSVTGSESSTDDDTDDEDDDDRDEDGKHSPVIGVKFKHRKEEPSSVSRRQHSEKRSKITELS